MSRTGAPPAPSWVQTVTVTAVTVVALVAAVVSYVHVRQLALQAGEGWRSYLIPLSVDGMLVAASMVMLVRRREGQAAGLLPWTGLLLGLGASLAANVASAAPDPLSRVVSAWPAVALAVSFELLILVLRDHPGVAPAIVADVVPQAEPAPVPRSGREIPPSVPAGPHPIPTAPKRKPLTAAEKARRAEKARQKRAAARQPRGVAA